MSKSILVMDTPERCSMCKFLNRTDEGYCYCRWLGFDYQVNEYMLSTPKGKPDWCPLREIPQKKPDKAMGEWLDFNCGYNACIDDVLKGEE